MPKIKKVAKAAVVTPSIPAKAFPIKEKAVCPHDRVIELARNRRAGES